MKLSFFGAAPDTGNLGVTALCYATLYNLSLLVPDLEVTVFDHGRGRRFQQIDFGERKLSCHMQGAVNSRRYYRSENLTTMFSLAKLGLKIGGVETIAKSDAVIDISGGDSFTDIYGAQRFKTVSLPKRITLDQGKPLILLPQTYGPFKTETCRSQASEIVKEATAAWARDERSFQVLKDLLGDSFSPERHRCGVDVAFGLPAVKPAQYSSELEKILATDVPKVGINVSGLIYNDPIRAKRDFGFIANYNRVVLRLVQRFLEETDCTVCLIPHVLTPLGHYESDETACLRVKDCLPEEQQKRVIVVQSFSNPSEIKWVISKLDWFCGTRMHSTIASLSTGVPTSGISYSPKTIGVFETCGQGAYVADPLQFTDDEIVETLLDSWTKRNDTKEALESAKLEVQMILAEQFKSIVDLNT